jgi:hypothetical protein
MKNTLIFLFFLLFSVQILRGQPSDYAAYYKTIRSAKKAYTAKLYRVALDKYQEAFDVIPYIHINNLIGAYVCAYESGDKGLAYYFLKKAVSQGYNPNETPFLINNFPNDVDELRDIRRIYLKKGLIADYKAALDTLIEAEQKIRTDVRFVRARAYWDIVKDKKSLENTDEYKEAKAIAEERQTLKDKNTAALLVLIKKQGFPYEYNVGRQTADIAYNILSMDDRDTTLALLPMLSQAFSEGKLSNFNYGWLLERIYTRAKSKESAFYQMGLPDFKSLTQEEILEIDTRRLAIGLPSITTMRIKTQEDGSKSITYEEDN